MSTLIFGDSFIGPFKLIDDKNLFVYKFKGSTMKGLTKENNENRKKIIDTVNNNNNIKCILFNFGQVDLYFSYYYDKFIKNKTFKMDSIIKKYVKFISELKCNNCKKIILAVYPSPIKDKHIFNCLLYYDILSNKIVESISDTIKEKLSNFNFRYKMYYKFNTLIKKYCKIYNINYINLDNELLNKDKTLKQEFINPESMYSIHLLWEPLIPILISKIKICNINIKYTENLKKSLENYLKQKKIRISKRFNK